MDEYLLERVLHEIKTQCKFIALSFNLIPTFFAADQSTTGVFLSLHSLMIHFANLSKIIETTSKNKNGINLWQLLKIKPDSLLRNRKLRNNLEHFDRELLKWYSSSEHHISADLIIGPRAGIGGRFDFFRLFDPETGKFVCMNEEVDINEIIRETTELLTTLVQVERDQRKERRKTG